MDSLTQIVLGAATTAVLVPAQHRKAALLAGAALGTLPDLDAVVLRFLTSDPLQRMIWHRGASHSLFLLPVVGWLIWLWFRSKGGRVAAAPVAWFWGMQLALITHPILDAFTVYGTQLWWPLGQPPAMWSSVFVVDLLYTLPLLLACVWAWCRPLAKAALVWGLALSSAYLAWGQIAKHQVETAADAALRPLGLHTAPRLTVPAPFTTLLWRVLVMTPDGNWMEGYRSLVADQQPLKLERYTSAALPVGIAEAEAVQQLRWFSQGFMASEVEKDSAIITDLRMGSAPHFIFRFKVGQSGPGGWSVVPPEQLPLTGNVGEQMSWLWQRLWHEPHHS
jgi:inner membrane protein